MNITEPFVLKSDVLLIPCADLDDDVRRRITFTDGDVTVSQRFGRTVSQVVDRDTAALLQLFRQPCTIVDAVIANSRALGRDPRERLDELLPHFDTFIEHRVLVPHGSEEEHDIRPRFDAGAKVAGWRVIRCVSLMEDSEVYHVRRGDDVAALKIGRIESARLQALFDSEIEVLRHLDGSGIAPRLLDAGVYEARPYLISEWIVGVDATVAAAQARHDRAALAGLCASIANAYAALHARGVLHGDVHPRNVVVGERVMLLDFGYARFADRPPRSGRGGFHYYFEPEHFAADREERDDWTSFAGEQYGLAAMLYELITGKHYLDFQFDREAMERQIETEAALPFAARGIPPWPEVERVLVRALEKVPARRWTSVAEMGDHFAHARASAARESLAVPLSVDAHSLLDSTLISFARGDAFTHGYDVPTASVYYGAAGAAAGLLRIAEVRSDPALLALAHVWSSRAVARIGNHDAYWTDEPGMAEMVGNATPYHTESGIRAVAAMVAAARGDAFERERAIDAFIRASSVPCAELDLTLGRSGSLLAAAMLLEHSDTEPLRAFGSDTMRAIWSELDAHPPIDAEPPETYLGVAHGWAGYLYAALRWCAASGDPLPPRLVERLHEYAALQTPIGRGVCWRVAVGRPLDFATGWCHGAAGPLFLFTLAHRLLGDDAWLRLAELCAWKTWDEARGVGDLCCGTAGRAYALLNFYRHTGASEWLGRARQLANHAATVTVTERPHSLWKGQLGPAVLIADLASPESARMPFLE